MDAGTRVQVRKGGGLLLGTVVENDCTKPGCGCVRVVLDDASGLERFGLNFPATRVTAVEPKQPVFTLTVRPTQYPAFTESVAGLEAARLRASAVYGTVPVTITDESGVEYRRFTY